MNNNIKTKPRIRIGNDVKLDVCLSKEYIEDAINIKSIKCVLINTTMAFEEDEHYCHHNHHHCGGCDHGHCPTACSLHSCGHRCYHCDPHNWDYINKCGYFHNDCGQSHLICMTDNCHAHCHHYHYHPCVCHHGQLSLKAPCRHCHCGKCCDWDVVKSHHGDPFYGYGEFYDFITDSAHNTTLHHDLERHPIMPFEYYPEVISTLERNRFFILFPANDQRFIGNYTLVVTAEVYESGYNKDNVRTITIDYPNVFQLVETTCQADKDVLITVGTPDTENIDYICACGPAIDRVLKGNAGVLTAKVMPESIAHREIVWTNPTGGLDLLNTEGEVLQYVGKCCDIESGEETFIVRASSKYFADKYVDFNVTVYNYAKQIQVYAPSVGETIAYDKTVTFSPEVLMQNGDKISSYRKNLQLISATTVDGYVKDDQGVTLAIITNNGAGTYTIKNRNPYNEERTVRVIIKSSLPTEDGSELVTTIIFKLAGQSLDVYGGYDKFISSANYSDELYDLNMNRSDGERLVVELDEAVGWTNK